MDIRDYVYYGGFIHGEGLTEYHLNFRRRMNDTTSASIFWIGIPPKPTRDISSPVFPKILYSKVFLLYVELWNYYSTFFAGCL